MNYCTACNYIKTRTACFRSPLKWFLVQRPLSRMRKENIRKSHRFTRLQLPERSRYWRSYNVVQNSLGPNRCWVHTFFSRWPSRYLHRGVLQLGLRWRWQDHTRRGTVRWIVPRPDEFFVPITLSLPTSKRTFSRPFKGKYISKVVGKGTVIIFHLGELWKAKFFITVWCHISGEAVGENWN